MTDDKDLITRTPCFRLRAPHDWATLTLTLRSLNYNMQTQYSAVNNSDLEGIVILLDAFEHADRRIREAVAFATVVMLGDGFACVAHRLCPSGNKGAEYLISCVDELSARAERRVWDVLAEGVYHGKGSC